MNNWVTEEDIILSTALAEDTNALQEKLSSPVGLIEAGGRGDCLFFSIHDALIQQGLKGKVDEVYSTQGTKEEFVQKFRTLVADNGLIQVRSFVQSMCARLFEYPEDFQSLVNKKEMGLPDWVREILQTMDATCLDVPSKYKLIRNIQDGIRVRGNYAFQVDISIIQNLLKKCGLYLEIKNRAAGFKSLRFIKNRIVLQNLGEGHFRYYAYDLPKSGGYFTYRLPTLAERLAQAGRTVKAERAERVERAERAGGGGAGAGTRRMRRRRRRRKRRRWSR